MYRAVCTVSVYRAVTGQCVQGSMYRMVCIGQYIQYSVYRTVCGTVYITVYRTVCTEEDTCTVLIASIWHVR